MRFDCDLADAELISNLFVQETRHHQRENLALPVAERGEASLESPLAARERRGFARARSGRQPSTHRRPSASSLARSSPRRPPRPSSQGARTARRGSSACPTAQRLGRRGDRGGRCQETRRPARGSADQRPADSRGTRLPMRRLEPPNPTLQSQPPVITSLGHHCEQRNTVDKDCDKDNAQSSLNRRGEAIRSSGLVEFIVRSPKRLLRAFTSTRILYPLSSNDEGWRK